jgi:LmbE family N-acetylglucosaminyl deacetylase
MVDECIAAGELADAVLIVAHPDDEILWFASVAEHVGKIVICFLDDPAMPDLADARRRTLDEHPLADRIECLGLTETCSFGHADWNDPKPTSDGLRIMSEGKVADAYVERAAALRTGLAPFVAGANHVFTHNPWGEYGHEEHVMVHRVVSDLAAKGPTSVWYSNYASSWTTRLMLRYCGRAENDVFARDVDTESMKRMSLVYRDHDTWTWFDDYEWFDTEHFVRGPLEYLPQSGFGWMFPINLITLPDRPSRKSVSRVKRLKRRLLRLAGRRHGGRRN